MDRLITMIFRRLLNRGISAGIDMASRRGKDPAQMTPEERQQAQSAKQTAKRARQAMRLGRRIGRM